MKIIVIIAMMLLECTVVMAQHKKFNIERHQFIIEAAKVKNTENGYDDVRKLYRIEKGKEKYLLTYYAHKDEGGDCNNLFWLQEELKVEGSTVTITTHHFQKTGMDPITEWEKRVYKIQKDGKMILVQHLFKQYGKDEWKESEEWYGR